MDRLGKTLQKLTLKEKRVIKETLQKIRDNNTQALDTQKLKGRKDIFRVRKGNLRIIYRKQDNGEILVLTIERRSEKTYRGI